MFTGIITHLGSVADITSAGLKIEADRQLIRKLSKGVSIAVDGICLTVVSFDGKSFTVNFMPETQEKTNIRYLRSGSTVNLELPVTVETFLAGHIVQGHVDTVSETLGIEEKGNSRMLSFSIPKEIGKYIVKKGSIAVNGISLTVIEAEDKYFTVGIIPHTWEKTNLHELEIGDYVNVETDVLAKYIERLSKN